MIIQARDTGRDCVAVGQTDLPHAVVFLRQHGDGLRRLVAAIDDPYLTRDSARLVDLAFWIDPPLDDILSGLADLESAFECVDEDRLSRGARKFAGPDIHASFRWHGARLADLLAEVGR